MLDQVWRTAWRSSILLSLAWVLAVCGGCASNSSDLRMVSLDHHHNFDQKFSEAYINKDPTGDTDVVLVSEPRPPAHQDPRKPLSPAATAMPRQIVHIRIYWRPMVGTHADRAADTNASIHWFLMDNSNEPGDLLEYSGSGLVDVDESDDVASITIQSASMKAAHHRGSMVDPLGPSILNGSIEARIDPQQVKAVLASLKVLTGPIMEAHAGAVPGVHPND